MGERERESEMKKKKKPEMFQFIVVASILFRFFSSSLNSLFQ